MTNPYDDRPPTAIKLPAIDNELYLTVGDWVRRKQEREEIFASILEPTKQPLSLPPLAPDEEPAPISPFIDDAQLDVPTHDGAIYVIRGEEVKPQDSDT